MQHMGYGMRHASCCSQASPNAAQIWWAASPLAAAAALMPKHVAHAVPDERNARRKWAAHLHGPFPRAPPLGQLQNVAVVHLVHHALHDRNAQRSGCPSWFGEMPCSSRCFARWHQRDPHGPNTGPCNLSASPWQSQSRYQSCPACSMEWQRAQRWVSHADSHDAAAKCSPSLTPRA